jgi:hypothetical protein
MQQNQLPLPPKELTAFRREWLPPPKKLARFQMGLTR